MNEIINKLLDIIKPIKTEEFDAGYDLYLIQKLYDFLDDRRVVVYYSELKEEISSQPQSQTKAIQKRTMAALPVSSLSREMAYETIIKDTLESLLDRLYMYKNGGLLDLCTKQKLEGDIQVSKQIEIQNAFLDLYSLLDKMLFNIYAIKYNLNLFDTKTSPTEQSTSSTLINYALFLPNGFDVEEIKRFQHMGEINGKTNFDFKFGCGKDLINQIKLTYLFMNDYKFLNLIRNNLIHNETRCDLTRIFINMSPNDHPIKIYLSLISKLLFEILQLFKIACSVSGIKLN